MGGNKQYGMQSAALETPMLGWTLLRANATEDSTAAITLATANMDFATRITGPPVPDGVCDVSLLGYGANAVEIAFFSNATDADGDTFGFTLWAFRDSAYSYPKPVFTTAATGCALGTGICAIHPVTGVAQANGLWCDTIAGTDNWDPSDGVRIDNSAANGICTIRFDMRGYRYLMLDVFAADGSGTECGTIGAIISGY